MLESLLLGRPLRKEALDEDHGGRLQPITSGEKVSRAQIASAGNTKWMRRAIHRSEHAVQGHLGVPKHAEHEQPVPAEHDPLGVDQALVLLALAHDRQIGLAVVGVPVRVFLADEIDDLASIPN